MEIKMRSWVVEINVFENAGVTIIKSKRLVVILYFYLRVVFDSGMTCKYAMVVISAFTWKFVVFRRSVFLIFMSLYRHQQKANWWQEQLSNAFQSFLFLFRFLRSYYVYFLCQKLHIDSSILMNWKIHYFSSNTGSTNIYSYNKLFASFNNL